MRKAHRQSVEECRQRARELRAIAGRRADLAVRAALVALAEEWEARAGRLEAGSRPALSAPPLPNDAARAPGRFL
jgi:hypothetical protein